MSLESRTQDIGREIFDRMAGKTPSIFDKQWWSGRVMEWCMRDDALKVEMFRFVDAFPQLSGPEAVARHLKEYFGRPEQSFPTALQLGLKAVSPTSRLARMVAGTIEKNIRQMAGRFIAGASPDDALPALEAMRAERVAFSVDLLGETCVSEAEARVYQARYLELLGLLAERAASWEDDPLLDEAPRGRVPRVNVSVKVSALDSQLDPIDRTGSVARLVARLEPILIEAKRVGALVNLDMEHYALKAITLEAFHALLADASWAEGPDLGVVIQAYLKDSRDDVAALLKAAKKSKRHVTVRLVKGAYWDYEVVLAQQHGWEIPVFTDKAATDANFEQLTDMLLKSKGRVSLAVGSHNVRSIAHAIAQAESRKLAPGTLEFQMLYGMAEPIKRSLVEMGYRVRDYVPVGELVPGMAYLVRRLLENTSNESFLRSSFVEAASHELLLADPASRVGQSTAQVLEVEAPAWGGGFAELDFRRPGPGTDAARAIAQLRAKGLDQRVPVVVGGHARHDRPTLASPYPADPRVVVATSALATTADVDEAVAMCRDRAGEWRALGLAGRAVVLRKAARIMAKRRYELLALQLFEVAKSRAEADADVCEAVDFLNYYAHEAERLAAGVRMGREPGEMNRLSYHPRGVGAVIAPWNFPMAILTGMTAATLVAGNAALMKPAEQSPASAYAVYRVLLEAGVPPEVLHFLPGVGEEIGPHIVAHPGVDLIAFTGSQAVGLQIIRNAAVARPGQRHIKRVIAELGGKNAIVVDDDADLDEAVQGVVASAFGFQGQKCSACSRAIVLEGLYDAFVERLVEATRSLPIGPPTDPGARLGPVIDAEAQQRIERTIESAAADFERPLDPAEQRLPATGFYVRPTIFVGVDPAHSLAQHEIFGPVLAVISAASFDEAIAIANGTAYALTGGLFSRSPAHIEQARRELEAGNLYINRGITGALVGRQPFGGSAMSGVGSKAGGPDYLMQFLEPRTHTENTMRRGFSPETV